MKPLCALVLVGLALPAAAEKVLADSVEWAAADSDLVVRGQILKVGQGQRWHAIDLQVTALPVVKTDTPQGFCVAAPASWGKQLKAWQELKTSVLVFVWRRSRLGRQADDASCPFVVRPSPAGGGVIEVGKAAVATRSFAVVSGEKELLAAVRSAATSAAKSAQQVKVPGNTAAYRMLYRESTVFLNVPVDAELERQALEWVSAEDLEPRVQGALALAHFRSPPNIARLEALLGDPGFSEISEPGRPRALHYEVRRAAHQTLTGWGVTHATPVLVEPKRR